MGSMTDAEIEAALAVAFGQCEAAGIPLEGQQKVILLQVMARILRNGTAAITPSGKCEANPTGELRRTLLGSEDKINPLADLTQNQRQALLQFIQERDNQDYSWKMQLLNDWLQGQDSGAVQFVREELGLQWLERVQPLHIAQYADELGLKLKVGDRIEVSNSLWEWVQDDGPCCREWYPCMVVAIAERASSAVDENDATHDANDATSATAESCIVRFDNGTEYEIQAVYGWNQYQWRWVK